MSAAQEAAEEAAALPGLVAAAGPADAAVHLFGRLHHDESLAAEAHRERLAGAAPDQRSEAELVGAVVSGLQRGRPADRRLWIGVCGLVDGQHDRSALRGDGDAPGTRENAV